MKTQLSIKRTLMSLFSVSVMSFSFAQTWQDVGALPTQSNSWNGDTELILENDSLFASFYEGTDKDIFVKQWDGTVWTQLGNAVSTDVDYHSLGRNNSKLYVAFSDPDEGNKMSVKTFNGTTWENVGLAGFTAGSASHISIDFHQNNLYIAYNDATTNLTLKMFDGVSWTTVTENITNWSVGNVNLDFWGNNPCIAYRELENSTYRTVFTSKIGAFWTEDIDLTTGSCGNIRMSIHNNEPYVAYTDQDGKAIVQKKGVSTWTALGGAATDSICDYLDMEIHNGIPYISFREIPSWKLRVLKFDGTSWTGMDNVSGEVSNYESFYTSIEVDPATGNPIVLFSDKINSEKATVIQFISNVGVQELQSVEFSVFPNPVEDIIHIQSDEQIRSVSIINVMGKAVLKSTETSTINLEGLEPGVYLLNIKTAKGQSTKRIIKK
jgi:hypothetical protein